MQKTDATEELKNAISSAQTRQAMNGQLLKEQIRVTFNTLKPAHLLRSTLKEVTSSPFLFGNLAGSVIGLSTGYLSKKLMIGSSVGVLRKLMGYILQYGVTNIISKNSEVIGSYGKGFVKRLFSRRKTES